MATAVKRQHEPQRIVGGLLTAEISEKQPRSIKYQLTIAKLPLAKDIDDFRFEGTPINQTLVNDLAGGGLIAQQRNAVLVGGTGTGKTHLAIAIARSCIRSGARGRFDNVVDFVNRLETETRNGHQGRRAYRPINRKSRPVVGFSRVISGHFPKSSDWLAGAGGFEPPYGGIKIHCLTTWRRPNRLSGKRRDWPSADSLRPRRSIERVEPFQQPITRNSA